MNSKPYGKKYLSLWKEREGSITLEATIILPFFLVFVLALITIIHIIMTELALQSAVHETVKQMAAHMYPVYLLHAYADVQTMTDPIKKVVEKFPPEWREILVNHFNEPTEVLFLPLLKSYANSKLLDPNRLHISSIQIPDFSGREAALLELTATYEYHILLPFISKEWNIYKRAAERVWIGQLTSD